LLLRILLIGYLYGITSERKLVEELRMHLAWRRHRHRHSDQENAKCRSTERRGHCTHP
jgi:transposase